MTRVLVVDDKEENLYYLQTLLTGHGFVVDVAHHGAEALVIGRQHIPDMIVSDLLMPVMDGYTLLRHWKADERLKHVPFVVYTATYTEAEDERLALDLGADAFILKPAEPDDFLSQIREIQALPSAAEPNAPNEQAGEEGLLRTYSETLIRKLEEKSLQLEETNRALEADIAERQRVEMALRASIEELEAAEARISDQARLLDLTQDAILVHDVHHQVRYWNKGAERMYGWAASEAVGRSIAELHCPDIEQLSRLTDVLLQQGEWSGELQMVRRDGADVIVESRRTLLPDHDGGPRSVLVVDTDVTERKRIEAQFFRAQRVESIGTLAGGMAHDLNNLLAPIIIGAELLRLQNLDDEAQEVIDAIEASAQRGADLVRQVLSFARGIDGARLAVRLDEVVDEVMSIAATTFPKSITCESEVADDLWEVIGDHTQLNQVLLNLCVNARDAMDDGGHLVVTARNAEIGPGQAVTRERVEAGNYVVLEVRDDGCGMSPTVLDRIFEPFMTTKEVGSGTGLGLSTLIGIVESHGGFVDVHSRVGEGSVFEVYLPAAGSMSPEPDGERAANAPSGQGELILVVDDEAAIRAMTRQTLESAGYRVLTAVDGSDALDTYHRHRGEIAVVLTDMTMPVMNGATLIVALQALDPGVRVIATSGVTTQVVRHPSTDGGTTSFLLKPYRAARLLSRIRSVLDRPLT